MVVSQRVLPRVKYWIPLNIMKFGIYVILKNRFSRVLGVIPRGIPWDRLLGTEKLYPITHYNLDSDLYTDSGSKGVFKFGSLT